MTQTPTGHHGLTELDTIKSHRPRPICYSLKLIALCFGFSIAVHAAVMLSMVLSPVPPASPWAAKPNDMPDGERHVVKVTLAMDMSNFAQPPEQAQVDQTNEDRPTAPAPLTPVAVPELDPVSDASPIAPPPSAAKPPHPADPTPADPPAKPLPQPIALDLPEIGPNDAPLPPTAEAAEPKPSEPPTPAPKVPSQASADVPEAPAAKADTTEPAPTDKPQEEKTQQDKPRKPVDPPAQDQPSETTPDAPAPTEPETRTTTDSTPTAPPTTDKEQAEDEKPAAVVYDEDSVDQPIAFEKMARPKPSTVSKRLGDNGTVRILVEVDKQGNLIRHEVIDDAGHARLLDASLDALRDSTFLPAQRGGDPVHSTRVIEYRF